MGERSAAFTPTRTLPHHEGGEIPHDRGGTLRPTVPHFARDRMTRSLLGFILLPL
jgi:hypothetical protein